jgi:ATP-binding cassette subfamily C protein
MNLRQQKVLGQYLHSVIQHHRASLLFSVVITVFSGLTKGSSLLVLLPLLRMAGLSEEANANSRSYQIANYIWTTLGIPLTLYSCLACYLLLTLIYALLGYTKTLLDARILQEYKRKLRNELFVAVIDSEWSFVKNTQSTNIFNNLLTEINNIGYITYSLVGSLSTAVILIFYTFTSLYVSFKMTVLATACFLPLLLIQRRLNKRAYAIGEAAYERHEGLFKAVLEFINSFKLAKSYNFQQRYVSEFQTITRKTMDDEYKFIKLTASTDILYEVGSAVIIVIVLILAITVVQLPVVDLLLMVYIASKLLPNFSSLFRNFQYLLNTLPSYEGVAALLNEARHYKEQENDRRPLLEFPKQSIRFSDVSFGYENGTPVFDQFNCEIKIGQTTSIVGASGKGKTTLMDLLLGLLKPSKGTIWIDTFDLNTLDLVTWRRAIAYIPQECFLFHTTIRQNLLWAKPDASEAELREALTLAAGDFVFSLANGLDTVVGDLGVRLSGGERQRIALARALLRQPSLLILDEATNAVDNVNESIIQKAIERLRGKVTIIIISHHVKFHEGADNIIIVK